MEIDSKEFCHLARAENFLEWLRTNSPSRHTALVEFLKTSQSCKANQNKMTDILRAIMSDRQLAARLARFIRKNYPAMILGSKAHKELQEQRSKAAERVIQGTLQAQAQAMEEDNVFAGIDMSLMALPRRKMITLFQAVRLGKDLASAAAGFCIEHAICEFVLTNSAAWIEYIPRELSHLADSVPEKSWAVRRWKKNA